MHTMAVIFTAIWRKILNTKTHTNTQLSFNQHSFLELLHVGMGLQKRKFRGKVEHTKYLNHI